MLLIINKGTNEIGLNPHTTYDLNLLVCLYSVAMYIANAMRSENKTITTRSISIPRSEVSFA